MSALDEAASEVWRLILATLRWLSMPALNTGRLPHACRAVRGEGADWVTK